MRPLVVPGLVVDGVDAEELHPSRVDVVAEGLDHPLARVLVLVAPARGEDHDGGAVVAVDLDPHAPAEPGRMPSVVFDQHLTLRQTDQAGR